MDNPTAVDIEVLPAPAPASALAGGMPESNSSSASKGKGKGTVPKAPPTKGKGKRKDIAPEASSGHGYKTVGGANKAHDLLSVKLKPTQTTVRQIDGTLVHEKRSADGFDSELLEKHDRLPQQAKSRLLPTRMDSNVTSEDAEKALMGDGYRQPFAILNANQALVREGFATVAHTSLVEYKDKNTELSVAALVQELKDQGRTKNGRISISESWTDEALRYLRRERYPGEEHVKLVALNYANCSYPGGNYSDGGMVRAQEEELCRQFPALFESLKTCSEAGAKDGRHMCEYENHVFGARISDGYRVARNVLFTEEVSCLRGSSQMNYRLLRHEANMVKAGFVEAAAPIFDRGFDAHFEVWRTDPEEWYEKVFLNVFWAPKSIDPQYDVIVVGPWGCGAFGNDPDTVARSFLNVIRKHRLLDLYREIHFCMGRSLAADTTVGGACNYNVAVFRQVLGTLGNDSAEDYTRDLQFKAAQWLDAEQDKEDFAEKPCLGHNTVPTPSIANNECSSLYFAFGSNMDPARMVNRNVKFTRRRPAQAEGWKLTFFKVGGYATMVRCRGSTVHGVLYDVDPKGILELDDYEGVAIGHYSRERVHVECEERDIEAFVYLATREKTRNGLKPSATYLQYLLCESSQEMLPPDYYAWLAKTPTSEGLAERSCACLFDEGRDRLRGFQDLEEESYACLFGEGRDRLRVFVYGTLMRGYRNHRLLEAAQFLGCAATCESYTMLCEGIPYVDASIYPPAGRICGEVFVVDFEQLKDLDRLECHPGWYHREPVEVELKSADSEAPVRVWALIYFNEDGEGAVVESGQYAGVKYSVD